MRTPGTLLLTCLVIIFGLAACATPKDPPEGWANHAPTVVEKAVDRGASQLLYVRQGELSTWVQVPQVQARVGDHVLLGRGTLLTHVPIPELSLRASEVVEIARVRVVDEATARQLATRSAPSGALAVAQVYAELLEREGTEVLVFGRVVRAPRAVGSTWVHIQDGGTHDLTIQTQDTVVVGQWVAFRGTLRRDVNLGFGYHYPALVENGVRVDE